MLALAGKFDSIVLTAISDSDSYLEVSEGLSRSTDISQQNEGESIFTEEYTLDDNCDENEREDSTGKLMKQEGTHGRACITAFSSGTGIAGIVGYGYKTVCELFGMGLTATVWSAMTFAVAYLLIYLKGLHSIEQSVQQDATPAQSKVRASIASESTLLVKNNHGDSEGNVIQGILHNNNRESSNSALEMVCSEIMQPNTPEMTLQPDSTAASSSLTAFERFKLVISFWPYTIPLFTVYAAEYMLQAGVWSAIGFPVTSASARAQFYHNSNWTVSGTMNLLVFLYFQFN